jgi:hypothetical protein
LVENEFELTKVLAREVARALRHDEQGRELVDVALNERAERLEVIAGRAAPMLAIAARGRSVRPRRTVVGVS